jgi:hypothetical protein
MLYFPVRHWMLGKSEGGMSTPLICLRHPDKNEGELVEGAIAIELADIQEVHGPGLGPRPITGKDAVIEETKAKKGETLSNGLVQEGELGGVGPA